MSKRFMAYGGPAIALLCAMHCGTAQAQDQVAGEPGAGGAIALEGITIFATLSPIASFDYPGQVGVVDRDELETRQASTLGDIFADVPGVQVDGGARRSGQAPTIRGIRTEDILILVDGARQSFVSGHDGRLFVEPDFLKRVEVVKGPASSLYGSGALGGVIALTTVDALDFLDAGETQGVRVKAGFGTVNEEMLFSTTAFARSLDGRFDIVGGLAYRDTGDITLGNGFELPDDHEIVSSLFKGTVQLSPGLSLATSWIHYVDDGITPNNPQYNTVDGVPSGDSIPVDVFRNVLSDTVQSTLSYKPADNNLIDGNLQVYWSRVAVEEDEVKSARTLSREVETAGVKLDNRSRFDLSEGSRLTLTYGGEYYADQQVGKDSAPLGSAPLIPIPGFPFDPTTPGNVPSGTADFYGVFAQAELVVAKPFGAPGELTLLPGVRWDHFANSFDGTGEGFDDIDEQAVSPKFGISYKPEPWLLLFGNYGEAFRAPSFNEAYATGKHFPVFTNRGQFLGYNSFIPNPDLKPQDGNTIEAGAGLDFKDVLAAGDKLTLKGSYWTSAVDNFIDLEVVSTGCVAPFNPLTCTSQNVNRTNAELDGVEIELKYDTSRFFGGLAYSTIDGIDTSTGDYLGVLQPDKFYVNAGVKVPEIWARFGTRVTFAGDFTKVNPDDRTGELPTRDAYTTVDVYAVFEPGEGPLKGFRLDLGIDNVADADYEVVSADVSEPGVNYKAAVTWTHKW